MECYEGAKMIKTFRGLMVDGVQDAILLHTNNGSTGYRIVKFNAMPEKPGRLTGEHVMQIFSTERTAAEVAATDDTDFSNPTLLGVLFVNNSTSGGAYPPAVAIVVDNKVFNQDIYITHVDSGGSGACNYHIELEQVSLDLNENTVATLKDIRNKLL